jgi:hypothetical protein
VPRRRRPLQSRGTPAIDSRGVNSQDVAAVPACEECGDRWLSNDAERWLADFVDDGPGDVLKFWCPECWRREFT